MTRRDDYYNRAKQEGYRSRAAYKLKQLNEEEQLFTPNSTVVDLGAAPGGWLQVAAEEVGDQGAVIGVDLQRIKPLDTSEPSITTIRGDLTTEETKEQILELAGGTVSCVLSDMAPNMSGEYSLDQARSLHLARQAYELASDILETGGNVVIKVFEGPDVNSFRKEMEDSFQYVRVMSPPASRDSSSEIYLIGKGRLTAPIAVGDQYEVTISDTGSEGDGIAQIDGFTVFVPDTTVEDTVRIEITDVKPRFGFGELITELED